MVTLPTPERGLDPAVAPPTQHLVLMKLRPIHPFPARMASEIALQACTGLPEGATVLDPMSGSGTVLRVAAESGNRSIGRDLDPLAVLMATVWTTPAEPEAIASSAINLVQHARDLHDHEIQLPWIDEDPETKRYVESWFAEPQRGELRRLSALLAAREDNAVTNALRVALSRTIITKEKGASLGADVSHSRPHRVRTTNDYQVYTGFVRAARRLGTDLRSEKLRGTSDVRHGDARRLFDVADHSVDAVITSPPYLNAIDYLRGHRLALVWLGHSAYEVRDLRSSSIGSERQVNAGQDVATAEEITAELGLAGLQPRWQRIVQRYALDMLAFLRQMARVLNPEGRIVLVVGDSCLRGVFIRNSPIIERAAELVGLHLAASRTRTIPASSRYLPPPKAEGAALDRRMSIETVQTYQFA